MNLFAEIEHQALQPEHADHNEARVHPLDFFDAAMESRARIEYRPITPEFGEQSLVLRFAGDETVRVVCDPAVTRGEVRWGRSAP